MAIRASFLLIWIICTHSDQIRRRYDLGILQYGFSVCQGLKILIKCDLVKILLWNVIVKTETDVF